MLRGNRSTVARRGPFFLVAGLLLFASAASAQYNAQILLPPVGFSPGLPTRGYAMNASGQVLGEFLPSNFDRRLALWTNGIAAEVPIPSGYYWEDLFGLNFVNDGGVVVSRLRIANGVLGSQYDEARVAVWQNGIAQVLPPPDSCVHAGHPFLTPLGLNNAGHVLLTTLGDNGCDKVWLWDGNSYTVVIDHPGGTDGYTYTAAYSHLNDADHIAIDHPVLIPTCSPANTMTGILAGGQFTPLTAGSATAINNHDQVLLYCLDGPGFGLNHLNFWDGSSVVDLGHGGQAGLNDRGDVLFMTANGNVLVPKIYKDGAVSDLVLPLPQTLGLAGGSLINAAGQIVVSASSDQMVMFTPRTPVITWPTPADLGYGTALGAIQLDATANVPGTFSYTPAPGTVLHAGNAQTLSVTFTPDDPSQYDPTTASVTINVLPASLAVSANSATKVFGAPLPSFGAGFSGFVNGDGPGALAGTLTLTTTATAASPVGTYAIMPAGLTSFDYDIAFVPGTLTIAPANTTTTAFVFPGTAGFLQPALLAALVAPVAPGAGTPDGTVQFRDGATAIGSAAVSGGIAWIAVNGLAPGTHTLTADYGGGSNFSGGVSALVTLTIRPLAASSFTLLFPVSNPQAAGQPATFAALAIGLAGGTPTGTVQFTENGAVIGTAPLTSGVAVFTTSALAAGVHTLGARYVGGGGFEASTSAPAMTTIYAGARPGGTAITASASPAPSMLGQAVTFTATVTGGATTGDVYFFADGIPLGHAALANVGGSFQAALTTSTLSAGAHVVTASYAGSAGFASSNTAPAVQVVQP